MDNTFDTALRAHFKGEPEPDDEGFSQRVMAALPVRPAKARIRWVELVELGRWAALSLAACGTAVLMSSSDVQVDIAHQIAAYTSIGLLVFWSIPNRWNRG